MSHLQLGYHVDELSNFTKGSPLCLKLCVWSGPWGSGGPPVGQQESGGHATAAKAADADGQAVAGAGGEAAGSTCKNTLTPFCPPAAAPDAVKQNALTDFLLQGPVQNLTTRCFFNKVLQLCKNK